MEQDLSSFLRAEIPEDAGDTAEATPTEAAPATATQSEAAAPADTGDEPTGDGEDAELRALIEQAKAKDPQFAELLERSHKTWQSGVTPKLQQAAELRKQIEGLDPADVQWLKQFNEARIYNPALAQQMWQQATQQVLGQSAPTPEAQEDPWVTDTERQLADRLGRMEQMLQEQSLAGIRAEVDRQWASIEAEQKVQVPHEQRLAVLQRMASLSTPERPIPVSELPLFWRGLYGYEHARSAGRGEGERIAATKAGIGAPPSSLAPTNDAPPERAKSLEDHLEREFGRV